MSPSAAFSFLAALSSLAEGRKPSGSASSTGNALPCHASGLPFTQIIEVIALLRPPLETSAEWAKVAAEVIGEDFFVGARMVLQD